MRCLSWSLSRHLCWYLYFPVGRHLTPSCFLTFEFFLFGLLDTELESVSIVCADDENRYPLALGEHIDRAHPEALSDRAVSYTVDLGRARYEAVLTLLKRLTVLHDTHSIERVLFGYTRLG